MQAIIVVIIYLLIAIENMTTLIYNVLNQEVRVVLDITLASKRFKELREKSGLTQAQLAQYLDIDQSYISKFEKNERQFGTDTLQKAADLFGCSLDCFIDQNVEHEAPVIALRANSVTIEDLETIASMNRLALNLRYMEKLLEGAN